MRLSSAETPTTPRMAISSQFIHGPEQHRRKAADISRAHAGAKADPIMDGT